MDNTQKFNLSKFNIKTDGTFYASADSVTKSEATAYANVVCAASAVSETLSAISVQQPATISQHKADSHNVSETEVRDFCKWIPTYTEMADVISDSCVKMVEVYDIDTILLPDIVLKPGQELVINTDDMTVPLDGQNAIHLLDGDSTFFLLMQGANLITYTEQGNQGDVSIKVMWKDRWL